jgi:hypothetical protein
VRSCCNVGDSNVLRVFASTSPRTGFA